MKSGDDLISSIIRKVTDSEKNLKRESIKVSDREGEKVSKIEWRKGERKYQR